MKKRNITEQSSDLNYIIKKLDKTKDEMDELINKMDFITDPLLLNQLIFRLKAAEMTYRYWYKLAKETYKNEVLP